ncbi:ribonuclease J [Nitratifractor sp.]|uniref:ribonuclease J n=1 Tax=Nitratifractor sp. TaxID=2268144 RepID=UPI0025E99EA4|nr:ribonuclease J [Nitratifractor sp.]
MEKNQNQSTENQNRNNNNRNRRRPNPFRNNKKAEGATETGGSERKEGNSQSGNRQQNNGGNRNENRRGGNSSNNKNRNQSNRSQGQNRSGGGRGRGGRRPKIDTTVPADMKAAILENERVQQERMNPWKQLDIGAKGKLRFTPLGGLGEIGGNIAVLETEKDAIIIDVGMSFPDETMHGVDILVPDFSYLHAIKDKIRAIVITHAHEDHIGAVPYLFKELKFPIYGTPLALAMIGNKFDEHGLQADKKYFNYIVKRKIYEIGEFKVEFMHMTHSIIDACSLAIQTPIGTLIHTADFKIDHTPIDGYTADLHRFAHYGAQGVLCLFSDSTNSHNPGFTKSEAVVGKTFDNLFEMAKGRVIMSTFSSNAHRIFQAIERGVRHGRKICVIGRSMERNIETVRRLGYIDVDDKHFIEAHEVNKYKDSEILVVTTGSQGETMAALSRMATDEHRHIKLKPTDTVIISASAIPGNEASVSKLLNLLLKAGVTVRYKECSDIHVSGHASQEEQKLILRLVQPKFFLPVHGEYNHIAAHARTAVSCGVDERNILLMSDGDQVEITPKYLKKVKTVKAGKRYIDNQNNKEIYADVVDDRQKLSTEGIVNIVAQISTQSGKLVDKPVVTSHGLVPDREDKQFAKEIEQLLESYLISSPIEKSANPKVIEDDIRGAVRKHILKRYKKYPIIIPTVFLV